MSEEGRRKGFVLLDREFRFLGVDYLPVSCLSAMVLFCNIHVGARVEVKWRGRIFNGKVRHKGGLVAREGDWVGVELDEKVGDGCGLYKGIRYFHCKDGHGIFTHPRNIRFPQNLRRSHDPYKTLDYSSSVDETLFRSSVEVPRPEQYSDPVFVTQEYLNHAKDGFRQELLDHMAERRNFHKSHVIGGTLLPAAYRSGLGLHSESRPATMMSLYEPTQSIYDVPRFKSKDDSFITSASIPPTHVPRDTYKRMVRMNYFGTTVPRYSALY